ncbi:MAG: MarR family transcriptional regulator [Deltaproteobacteria bacterium]|nr:MarR family transcriptional regulator [Deltaproteobacteria bacterium]MBW1942869.1 MarR family transcriptional regulator [Deltaproteobacteria bacterium]
MSIKFSVFPVDNSPGFIVHLLDTQMKAGLKRAFQSKGYNITPEQWGVLSRLWVKDGIHQNTVAKRTSKDRHTITRILNLLEKKGLIRRVPDPEDKRRVNIYLTPEGKGLKSKLSPIVINFLKKCFAGLDEKDLKEMERIHRRILKNLNSSPKR